jgi:hypothetical protein
MRKHCESEHRRWNLPSHPAFSFHLQRRAIGVTDATFNDPDHPRSLPIRRRVRKGLLLQKVIPAHKGPPDHREPKVSKVSQEPKANRALRGHKDRRVHQGRRVIKEIKVMLAHRG